MFWMLAGCFVPIILGMLVVLVVVFFVGIVSTFLEQNISLRFQLIKDAVLERIPWRIKYVAKSVLLILVVMFLLFFIGYAVILGVF